MKKAILPRETLHHTPWWERPIAPKRTSQTSGNHAKALKTNERRNFFSSTDTGWWCFLFPQPSQDPFTHSCVGL